MERLANPLALRRALADFDRPLAALNQLEASGQHTVSEQWAKALADLGVAVSAGSTTSDVATAIWRRAEAIVAGYPGR